MCRLIKTFLLSLFLISNLFAEEDVYSYRFNLDTTLTGAVVAEGNIFPGHETTIISYFYTFKNEKQPPSIIFFDKNFNLTDSIIFDSPTISFLHTKPLVFDFDGDSYDEVVFAVADSNKLFYFYFDPSNNPQIKTKIFEILINEDYKYISTHMVPGQLDKDDFYELILSINAPTPREYTIRGVWGIEIEKREPLWGNFTAENFSKSEPINIVSDSLSFLAFSSSGGMSVNSLTFSNNYYHFLNRHGERISYDANFNINNLANIDFSAKDYSTDSIAYIRAIDINKNNIWERKVNGKAISTQIDTIRIKNKIKILFTVYSKSSKSKNKNYLEIINPQNGIVERKVIFQQLIKSVFKNENRIFISFFNGKIIMLDYELNILRISYSPIAHFGYLPISSIQQENSSILIAKEGTSVFQNLVALNDELEIAAKIRARGAVSYLANSRYVTVYNSGDRKTKLYSIQPIPWYNRLSPTLLMNLTISFLSIVLVTMILWIITLRVSSKKIKLQKIEIEETHLELKETTSKLIRSEKLAVYGTIASGIAHEINSPLGAIINSAQRIKNNPSTDLEKNINLIEKAGKRSKAIIEKLLVNTRKKSDEKTNLVEALNDWRELSQRQFDNLGISFNSDIKCNCLLSISSTELNQIFTNLFFNARDAITENNSIIKEISISSQIKDNFCSFVIQDTGSGFSAEKLRSPFEAFETTKEKGKGTGLGLWVVKSILDSVNGSIKIRNYEKGAEIEVLIPHFKKSET